jgi:uncharacterized protein (DUF1330 family)
VTVYLISRFKVTNPERMQEYASRAIPMAKANGGSYLVRSESVEALDGTYDGKRLVILTFPDMEHFRKFWDSPEYQAIRSIRLEATEGDVWLVPG